MSGPCSTRILLDIVLGLEFGWWRSRGIKERWMPGGDGAFVDFSGGGYLKLMNSIKAF